MEVKVNEVVVRMTEDQADDVSTLLNHVTDDEWRSLLRGVDAADDIINTLEEFERALRSVGIVNQ